MTQRDIKLLLPFAPASRCFDSVVLSCDSLYASATAVLTYVEVIAAADPWRRDYVQPLGVEAVHDAHGYLLRLFSDVRGSVYDAAEAQAVSAVATCMGDQ